MPYIFKIAHTSPELITLAEIKKQLKLNEDEAFTVEDALLTTYIKAGIKIAENYINQSISEAKFKITANSFINNYAFIRGPISAIDSVKYYNEAETEEILPSDTELYELRPIDEFQHEIFYEDFSNLPTVQTGRSNAVTINIITGYASGSALPDDIRAAIYLIIGALYENRQDTIAKLPNKSTLLLHPYRFYY